MEKNCRVCSEKLYGRTDQRFCSDHCRNKFHNQKRKQEYAFLRRVDQILRKNRSILKQLWEAGFEEVDWHHLLRLGFKPDYCTGTIWKEPQQTFLFYEMALRISEKNKPPGKARIFRMDRSDYGEAELERKSAVDQSRTSMVERVIPSSISL
jgi:predicted nucleic acid-binding Zn ribbon protein